MSVLSSTIKIYYKENVLVGLKHLLEFAKLLFFTTTSILAVFYAILFIPMGPQFLLIIINPKWLISDLVIFILIIDIIMYGTYLQITEFRNIYETELAKNKNIKSHNE